MDAAPKIDAVRPVGEMRLLLRFHNGESRTYDCRPLLTRPEFRMLSDPGFFLTVKVDVGGYGISWNDDIDLSEHELWTHGEPVANSAIHASASASRR
jgi:hypothetical protein